MFSLSISAKDRMDAYKGNILPKGLVITPCQPRDFSTALYYNKFLGGIIIGARKHSMIGASKLYD
jgi:hypothetical protein